VTLLRHLWLWYGRRQGWLDISDGAILQGDLGIHPWGVVWRGVIAPSIQTIVMRTDGTSILAYNRRLSNAEIEELHNRNRHS
jgi:hypothetical protein